MSFEASFNARLRFLQQVATAGTAPFGFAPQYPNPFAAALRNALLQQLQPPALPPLLSLPPQFLRRYGQDAAPSNIANLFPDAPNSQAAEQVSQSSAETVPPLPGETPSTTGETADAPDTVPPLPDDVPQDDDVPESTVPATPEPAAPITPAPNTPTPTAPVPNAPVPADPVAPAAPVAPSTTPLPPELGTDPSAYTFSSGDFKTFADKFADIVKANGGTAYAPASDWDRLHNYLLFLSGGLKDQWAVDQSRAVSPDAAAAFSAKAKELIADHNFAVTEADLATEFPTGDGSAATALKTLTTLLFFKANGALDANWGKMIAPDAGPVIEPEITKAQVDTLTPSGANPLPDTPATSVSAPQPPTL